MKRNHLGLFNLLGSWLLGLSLSAGLALADESQNPQKQETEIEEINVTGSPLGVASGKVIEPVNIIDRADLRKKSAHSLGDALKNEPGITNASFGPSVGLPVIRGQTGNRVQVLEGGISSLDASTLSPDHATTHETLIADRIEVLRGPASLRYGSRAVGGVVNVIGRDILAGLERGDRTSTKTGAEIRSNFNNDGRMGGFYLSHQLSDRWVLYGDLVSHNFGNTKINGLAHREGDDHGHDNGGGAPDDDRNYNGYIPNTDGSRRQLGLSAGYIYGRQQGDTPSHVVLRLRDYDNEYGVPEGDERVRLDLQQTKLDIQGLNFFSSSLIESLNYSFRFSDYQHEELEDGGDVEAVFRNRNAWEARAELAHKQQGAWTGLWGTQLSQRSYSGVGDEVLLPESDISNQGFFAIERLLTQNLDVEFGVRLEQQSVRPIGESEIRHNLTSYSLSTLVVLGNNSSAGVILSRAERAPTVEELLFDGEHHATESYDVGDRNLGVEMNNSAELFYRYESGNTAFSINYYDNDFAGFIYQRNTGVSNPDGLDTYEYTADGAGFSGYELTLGLQLCDFCLGGSLQLDMFADSVRAQLDSGENVPRIPPQRLGAELTLSQRYLKASVELVSVGEQSKPGPNESATEGYLVLNMHADFMLDDTERSSFFVRGENLLDEEIRNSTSFLRTIQPEPGLTVEAGYRFAF